MYFVSSYWALRFNRTVFFCSYSIFLHKFTVLFVIVIILVTIIIIIVFFIVFLILVIRFSFVVTKVRSKEPNLTSQ